MWNRLRLAFMNLFKPAKAPPHVEGRGTDARARFWAGVEEGRREAEASSTRRST